MSNKYGLQWSDEYDSAQIERAMLRRGGKFLQGNTEYGLGLLQHFKNYWQFLWPEDDQTKWTDLLLVEVLANQFTAVIGPASSWKTGTIARLALMDWSVFPECTTVLQSSTDMDGLRSRVYGETTKMWKRASERFEWFPGHPIDHKCVIANDDIEEDAARDVRDGVVGVPCKTSQGRFLGMGKYAGRKNRRVWSVLDESQFAELAFTEAQNNLISNGPNLLPGIIAEGKEKGLPVRGYKCVFIGNPNPTRPDNTLHFVAEPEGGWPSIIDDGKTKVWNARQVPNSCIKCRVVLLDGLDSPNAEYPYDAPKWPHLVHRKRIDQYQEGSESYWSQGRGMVRLGLAGFKIITKELCDQHHAFDSLVWDSPAITKIGMVDAAYSGIHGDRCPVGYLEFGKCVDGKIRCLIHPHVLVPVVLNPLVSAEDQIAEFCKKEMEKAGVPPENFFFDGRGSLAMSFARIWSASVNAVEFGGIPTDRPVGMDIFIDDEETKVRRLKKAREHYLNFVSELWWSARYAIESDQVRGITMDIVLDAQPREWSKGRSDKIQAEPKKDLKKRTGISCDLGDYFVIGVEGARRRGFQISKLSNEERGKARKPNQLAVHAREYQELLSSRQLQGSGR